MILLSYINTFMRKKEFTISLNRKNSMEERKALECC